MKQKLRVMVADHKTDEATEIKKYLEGKSDIEEVMVFHDGIQTYEALRTWKPDVALLDFSLEPMGGLDIVEKMKKEQENQVTSIYMISSVNSEESIEKASGLGVSYFLLRPCQPESIYRRIIKKTGNHELEADMFSLPEKEAEESAKRLEEEVTKVIRELGIPAHIKGYHYIRDSIILAVNDIQILNYITKLLYPTIAKKYKTTSSSVERAIRHAIEVAFARGKDDLLEEMFGYCGSNGRVKPTNSEFIALIADKLRLTSKTFSC